MNFFILLGQSGHPLHNRVFAEQEVLKIAKATGSELTMLPVAMPWENTEYELGVGGQGKTDYPPGVETKTIRVAKDPLLELETKKFNLWLAWTLYSEGEAESDQS